MKILYTSGEVHKAIKQVLANGQRRRIAVVAYLGESAEAFLPAPKGMKIICSPEPGATSPRSVRSLISKGADLQFADDLHAKVYWSDGGCVITSANASGRALGRSNQKEAGVLINNSAVVDIERLIREVKPYAVTQQNVDRLEMRDREIRRALGLNNEKEIKRSFLQWYQTKYRESWKIGWWCGSDLEVARSAREVAERDYAIAEPEGALSVAKSQVRKHDWLLCFEITGRGVRSLEWMFVDFVVPVDPMDKLAYQDDNPFQAIQVHKWSRYPKPPFDLDRAFKVAFAAAAKDYGLDKIIGSKNLVPRESFLEGLIKRLGRAGVT